MTFLASAAEPTNLFTNGTFADSNGDNKAEGWTYWFGTVKECPSSVGEDGLTINADSSTETQRLTVHQTVSGLDRAKTYLLTGRYNVTSTGKGSLEIRYNSSNRLAYHTSKTNGWQTFSQEITGLDSVKLEIVVSQGATLTCSVDDISLVEVVEEPEYLDTLLLNGTFLDVDGNNVADNWTYWNGTAVAAAASCGEDGLTITADSSASAQRLTVNQTVKGLDASKTYRFTGDYNVHSTGNGSFEIGYIPNASGNRINAVKLYSKTNGWKSFDVTFTGCTSVKLEAATSSGATMTCTINNFKLEEVPSYTVTFDANGGSGIMDAVTASGSIVLPECGFTAPDGCTFVGWLVDDEVKAVGEIITFGTDITVKALWDDGNILDNPSYANTDISSIPGWTYYPAYDTSKYTASVEDGEFTGTVLNQSNLILHQTVKTNADLLNKTYRFTADVKTEDITGYAMFKIYLQNGSTQLHSYSSAQYKGDTDWTTVTIDFDLPATVCGQAVTGIKLEQYILKGTGSASFRNPSIKATGELEVLTEGDPVNSLVSNGGYEYTLSGAPAMWQVWESTGGINVESDRAVLCPELEDNYSSLHLSNVTEGSDSRGSVHQTFKIDTDELKELWGQSVKIGQWVKTENFEGDALALRVHYATVSGSYISKSLPVEKTQDWTYYEYIIDLPNTNFATLKIENLYDYAQGDVWIDNTVVTKYIKAKGLELDAEKIVLSAGATEDLAVTFIPANTTIQEVTWVSSDESVATVADGTITAVSEGVATITVTHVDGMEKQIAVLVADSEMDFTETIEIATSQNTSTSDVLPEGYDYRVAANPQFGTFLVEGGVYTYYPANDFSGSDTVTLLVSSDAGKCLVVVPLTVTAVNGAPEFDRMTIVTKAGEAVTGEFAATDPENDDLTFTVVSQPENGTVTIDGGSYTFAPNAGFQGYDAVTFSVSDAVKTAEKEVTIYVAPSADALLATVKTGHARLLADDARFEELKALIVTDENAAKWFARVKELVDPLLNDPTPVPYQCPDGVRLDTQGSKDVLNLAFMYRMTGEQVYLDRAKLELLYLCGLSEETYIDWHPSHLLDTAMTANGVAIAYDWLYHDLTDAEKAQVEEAIYQNALVEGRKQFEQNHMFVTNGENWNYICNGGFITAALALAHNENAEYNALAGEIIQRCYASIQYGLPQYAPEGASIEGISYWDYGTRYLVSLLASISSATTNNPFLDTPGLNITAEYPIYLSGKAGSYNYSDNDMVDAFGYLNMWLAHTYGDSSWNWYHKYYMEKGYDATIYDLLYYYPAEYGGDAPENLDKWYTNQAVTTMRHDFTDPNSSFLGFKGGLNGAPHGDVDIGSFIYDLYGYRWAEDFGKDDYNLTGYWEIAPGGTRWNYYRKNALGHNTLVFNPTKGANQTVGAYAGKTEQVLNQPFGGYTILDMTAAYQDNAVSVKRGFAYFDRTQVLIRDEFTLKAPGTAYWQMHTKASVEISEDGKTAILTQGDAILLLKLVGENATDDLRLASMSATTYEGVEYEGLKSNEDYTKVYVKADGVQKAVFNVLITPVDMAPPEVKALENWSSYDFSSKPVAKIGDVSYASLAEAVEAAADGETITLLSDVEGPGVVIDKSVTIDFGGYTYSFTEGVGSSGTPSNGFQIKQVKDAEGNKNQVTLKNGTLNVADAAADKFYILIQNYTDLTIEDMTLDGTNLDKWSRTDGDSYVLSNNSGKIVIKGETNITANDEGNLAFAFDVCDKRPAYPEVPEVEIDTTGVIDGKIEVSASLEENLTVKGGIFTADVSAYLAEGLVQGENGKVAPELPTATVTKIKNDKLTFALNFLADEATAAQLACYGNWYADFVLTVNKDVTFNANGGADGFLSGQYDEWSKDWVNVPSENVTLNTGESLKIMAYAAKLMGEPGLKYTYGEVYEVVKDFDCGVFFEPEFLEANRDLEVRLELRMYNPADENESYVIGETYIFTLGDYVAMNVQTGKLYMDVSEGLEEAKAGQTVKLLKDASDKIVTVLEETTFDLNGYKLVAQYVASFGDIVDSSESNSGRLKVDRTNMLIQEKNAQLPVNTGEGYLFAEVEKFNWRYKTEESKYIFQPFVEATAHSALKAGKKSSGVTIEVEITWRAGDGIRRQNFEYDDVKVLDVVSSYNSGTNKYGRQFALTMTGASELEDLKIEAVVRSETGVSLSVSDIENRT